MTLTKEKIKSIVDQALNANDDESIIAAKKKLDQYRLNVSPKYFDNFIDEMFSIPINKLIGYPIEKLQGYLFAVDSWYLYVMNGVNYCEARLTNVKYQYNSKLREAKIKQKESVTETEKEYRALDMDIRLQKLKMKLQAVETLYKLIQGLDKAVYNYHVTLQNIIRRKEREWDFKYKTRSTV